MSKRFLLLLAVLSILLPTSLRICPAEELAVVTQVDRQPLVAATRRLAEALEFTGAPLSEQATKQLERAWQLPEDREAVKAIQAVLDPLCLVEVHINPESRVKVKEGPVGKELLQESFRVFLVKVHNEAGVNPVLVVESPNAAPVYQHGRGARQRPRTDEQLVNPSDVPNRWLDVSLMHRPPVGPKLSSLPVEYKIILLRSRDAGKREASLAFNIGQGTQDIGFRNSVPRKFSVPSSWSPGAQRSTR
ncbi:MAG: hypothetical protein MI861_26210, partial [Pirellulales bacterium]|nr:hypothetical protein [Pirellulales bacterium]